jgi:hypothetical protein
LLGSKRAGRLARSDIAKPPANDAGGFDAFNRSAGLIGLFWQHAPAADFWLHGDVVSEREKTSGGASPEVSGGLYENVSFRVLD